MPMRSGSNAMPVTGSASAVAAIPTIVELNIGHFLVGEAIFSGFESAIKRMRALMDTVRAASDGQKSA